MIRENLRPPKMNFRLEKLNVIKIDPKCGYAVLPKELDFKEDRVYDKLLKQS